VDEFTFSRVQVEEDRKNGLRVFSHVSQLVLTPSFYAVTRNCTCLKRGENGVSDLALLDNADGSQAVGDDGGHRSSTFDSRDAVPFRS
jgi:hypothetical protein